MNKILKYFAAALLMSASLVTSVSYTQIGDVTITRSENSWKCDQIECPIETTFSCTVTKTNAPNDAQTLVRKNTCYSETNEVLKTVSKNSTVSGNKIITVTIIMNKNGAVSSSSSTGSVGGGNGYGSSSHSYSSNINNQFGKFDAAQFRRAMTDFSRDLKQGLGNINRRIANTRKEVEDAIRF